MKIYVIMGNTGEFDFRNEWIVEAVRTEQSAINRVQELNNLLYSLGYDDNANADHPNYNTLIEFVNDKMRSHEKGDPKFLWIWMSEVEYTWETVELK